MLVALLLSLQTVAAPRASGDVLDELIAKTSRLKSFTAIYEMTLVATDVTPATTSVVCIRIDYQAPDRAHVEMLAGADRVSQWLIGQAVTMYREGDAPSRTHVDFASIDAELAPIRRELEAAFPEAKVPRGDPGAVVYLRWSFNEKKQKADYDLSVMGEPASRTPLGWLAVLRDKGERFSTSDTRLIFDDDKHFRAEVSRETGFVEDLQGTSPKGTLHLQLKSLERDAAIDPQKFLPANAPVRGVDQSGDARKQLLRAAASRLRNFIYKTIAGASGAAWDDVQRAKITAVLRAYHEPAARATAESMGDWARDLGEKTAAWLHQRQDDGHSADELASDRDGQLAKLEDSLDVRRSEYLERLTVPESPPVLPRGAELLELERAVATVAFEELIRAPIVRDFEHATSLKQE